MTGAWDPVTEQWATEDPATIDDPIDDLTTEQPLSADALAVMRRDNDAVPLDAKLNDRTRVLWDRHCLLFEVDRLRALLDRMTVQRDAFKTAGADLARYRQAEVETLRAALNVVAPEPEGQPEPCPNCGYWPGVAPGEHAPWCHVEQVPR